MRSEISTVGFFSRPLGLLLIQSLSRHREEGRHELIEVGRLSPNGLHADLLGHEPSVRCL